MSFAHFEVWKQNLFFVFRIESLKVLQFFCLPAIPVSFETIEVKLLKYRTIFFGRCLVRRLYIHLDNPVAVNNRLVIG